MSERDEISLVNVTCVCVCVRADSCMCVIGANLTLRERDKGSAATGISTAETRVFDRTDTRNCWYRCDVDAQNGRERLPDARHQAIPCTNRYHRTN